MGSYFVDIFTQYDRLRRWTFRAVLNDFVGARTQLRDLTLKMDLEAVLIYLSIILYTVGVSWEISFGCHVLCFLENKRNCLEADEVRSHWQYCTNWEWF